MHVSIDDWTPVIRLIVGNAHYCDTRPQPAYVPTAPTIPTTDFIDGIAGIVAANPDRPTVLCAQEVMEHHADDMAELMGLRHYTFAPMHSLTRRNRGQRRLGLAIFANVPVFPAKPLPYSDFGDMIPQCWDDLDFEGLPSSSVWQEATITVDSLTYRIGNTHFKQASGYPPEQQAALDRLLYTIGDDGELVWGGDMNLPRGKVAGWDRICASFKDNIPPEIINSLDPQIHNAAREKGVRVLVDGIWTTPGYLVTNVKVHSGLSDHLIFAADVQRL